MKILYGVVGTGMGHAIRSSVVVEKLMADGHDVHIVSSGGAVDYLEERFSDVTEIWGLSTVMKDNRVRKTLTAAKNIKDAVGGLPKNAVKFLEVEREFDPDLAISDFETWAWAFGKLNDIPVICLDNIQLVNRCHHDDEVLEGLEEQFRLAKSIVKARTPGASHYLIPSFVERPVRKPRTTLVPPVLRRRILEAEPNDGDHLLVYQSSGSFPGILEYLRDSDRPAYVYGMESKLDGTDSELEGEGGVVLRPFSEEQFVRDLAGCAGVVASAGFTLISEALHLRKPYLATPVGDQFEQLMNARYLEKLGYGMCAEDVSSETIDAFLYRREGYREALEDYEAADNSETFRQLDKQMGAVRRD